MKQIGWLISRYLVQAIMPYFVFSWLLLSVILFVQQAGRFSDIFFSVNIPVNLIWQLTIALVPNVIAFTCPMAMLVGTIIGLSKMQGDSELVALRAAGVGNFQIAVPIVLLGVVLSLFAFIVNLEGVPLAASLVRSVALQTAIQKLESPIEPGVFNTEVAGYTIYVKGGDVSTGRWNNIFIHQQDPKTGDVRLITSSRGRIDVTDEASELVLEDATVSTLPKDTVNGKFASESIGEIRLAIKTRRGELIERLSAQDSTPEELGLSELSTYAQSREGKDRIEAQLLWQRRIILSITPLIFCILGTVLVLRFNRSGRGFGIFLSLVSLIGYYLFAFFGEQLARTGTVSVVVGGLLPIVASMIAIAWFSLSRRVSILSGWGEYLAGLWESVVKPKEKLQSRNLFVDLTTGLRDFDLLVNLLKYFLLTLGFLMVVSVIFTAFELWKFAGTIDGGLGLLVRYLFFLMPFLYLYFAPSAAMIGTLATYVIKSRQNEIVTWISSGQSVYRLLVPCFLLMVALGFANWQIQERIAPLTNPVQDSIRTQIRKGGSVASSSGKYWVANDKRIYSFELGGKAISSAFRPEFRPNERNHTAASDNVKVNGRNYSGGKLTPVEAFTPADEREVSSTRPGLGTFEQRPPDAGASDQPHDRSGREPILLFARFQAFFVATASDNEKAVAQCPSVCAKNITIYEFAGGQAGLQTVYHATSARWESGRLLLSGQVDRMDLREGKITNSTSAEAEVAESADPFSELGSKPSHMTVAEIRSRIAISESVVERRSFGVALEKRYATLLLPLVIALFTAPFSLSLHRSGRVVTVGYAVGLWLMYTGVTNFFEQMGMNGFLTPTMAVWSPILLFSMLGVYLLSKIRT